MVCVAIQLIVGEDAFPCWVVLWSAHLMPPIYAFPYIMRCWRLWFSFHYYKDTWLEKEQSSDVVYGFLSKIHSVDVAGAPRAGLEQIAAGAPGTRRSWFLRNAYMNQAGFTNKLQLGVVFASVVAAAILNATDPNYNGTGQEGHVCLFFEHWQFWFVELGLYCAPVALGLYEFLFIVEKYRVRVELVCAFSSWMVFAGGYFVLMPLEAKWALHALVPLSLFCCLWICTTFVVSIWLPLHWSYVYERSLVPDAKSRPTVSGTEASVTPLSNLVDVVAPTPPATEIRIRAMLEDPVALKWLGQYMAQSFCIESLYFLLAAKRYEDTHRPVPGSAPLPELPVRRGSRRYIAWEEAKGTSSLGSLDAGVDSGETGRADAPIGLEPYAVFAQQMAVQFVTGQVGAPAEWEINVSADVATNLKTRISSQKFSADLFAEAVDSVADVVQTDVLPRYIHTELYLKMLADQALRVTAENAVGTRLEPKSSKLTRVDTATTLQSTRHPRIRAIQKEALDAKLLV